VEAQLSFPAPYTSYERAVELLNKLYSNGVFRDIVARNLRVVDGDILNLYSVIYNINILKIVGIEAYMRFKNMDIDAVVTIETDGIPIALSVASILDTNIVVAKRKKEIGYDNFYEETYLSRDPPSLTTVYIPKEHLKRGMRILIVDDLLRSGRTVKAIINIIEEAKASLTGIFSLASIGNLWRNVLNNVRDIHIMVEY
jgi:adenine/guanine phosphoribosyltransferase-like PRPP-binding protein